MKNLLIISSILSAIPLLSWAQEQKITELGSITEKTELLKTVSFEKEKVLQKASPVEILGCPDGTVLGGEYLEDGGFSGYQAADSGRKGMKTVYYQYYNGCYNTINAIRFLGQFKYWSGEDWLFCEERGGIDENNDMTEPIRFEIGFHKMDADGMPGETIFKKEFDILGNNTGVATGYGGNMGNIYEFIAEFDQDISLYEGFFSVTAVQTGEEYESCWFGPFTSSSVPGFGLTLIDYEDGNEPELGYAMLPMCYCLKGDGNFAAQKSLNITRILSPNELSSEKHQKVQIELENIGEQDITGITLQLWMDDKLIATEEANITIKSLENYKYTFRQRIDLSDNKSHKITVRNITANEEKFGRTEYSVDIKDKSEGIDYCESFSHYTDDHLTSVKIGDINNQSEATTYSDFTDIKTTIKPGEKLTLEVEYGGEPNVLAAWIDWNNDKIFDDDTEIVCYQEASKNTAEVSIPENIILAAGEVRMRIIAASSNIDVCGEYYYGETEDYTIVVERNDDSPEISVDKNMIEVSLKDRESKNISIAVKNNNGNTLDGKLEIEYALPYSPDINSVITRSPEIKNDLKIQRAPALNRKESPKADDNTQYVLKYDRGQSSQISLASGDFATYATYYPGEMLSSINGMTISSVDVYIFDLPTKKTAIRIYGQGTTNTCGEMILEKEFKPVKNSWNHIILDKPISIQETDLWIGVYMEGFNEGEYHMGIDRGPSTIGFGDLVNVGGETWWSLNDLGIKGNYCIRANVTGERTPAINWLTLNKNNITINGNNKETVNVNLTNNGLWNTIYEAIIKIQSNDELNYEMRIPVYLLAGSYSDIEMNKTPNSQIVLENDMLVVTGNKKVQSINIIDMNGSLKSVSDSYQIDIANIENGIYLIIVNFADGTKEIAKTIIK